jgi:CheY-like chemotaxis protein
MKKKENIRVLLVDDERDFVDTLAQRLRLRELHVDVVYDGEQALSRLRESEPDVIVLDLRMPGLSGIEALRDIKKLNSDIQVIVLTGHGTERDEAEARRLGGFDFLHKPADIDLLLAKIGEAYWERFEDVLGRFFRTVCTEAEFVARTREDFGKFGFSAGNTIACVSVCRDEITQTLIGHIREKWGEAFNLSSLAGMFFAGKTGLAAAMHHAPNRDGRERYVCYALPHIAIDEEVKVGLCLRAGRGGTSVACGALNAFQREMAGGRIDPGLDSEDVEQSLLRIRLLREIPYGQVPGLLELTKIAQRAIQADLESALQKMVDTRTSDYAVATGVQIHGPDGNYVWPASCYAVVKGTRHEIVL